MEWVLWLEEEELLDSPKPVCCKDPKLCTVDNEKGHRESASNRGFPHPPL
jgi:hypothetical protein